MAQQEPNGDFPYSPSGPAEVDRMIKEHSELFSETQCKVCNAALISLSQKLAHYLSKKHASKVRRYMMVHGNDDCESATKRFKPSGDHESDIVEKYKNCRVCNMTFCSPVVAQSHYVGKVHAKNLRMQSASYTATEFSVSKAQGNMNVVHQGTAEQDPNRFCTICQASFNNPLMAQQHYSGKKHKKHINKQKLMETYGTSTTPASKVKGYPCDMCNIELNSVEQYNAHIGGSKHRNQLKGNKEQNFFPAPTNYNQDDQYHESQLSLEDPGEWDSFNQ